MKFGAFAGNMHNSSATICALWRPIFGSANNNMLSDSYLSSPSRHNAKRSPEELTLSQEAAKTRHAMRDG